MPESGSCGDATVDPILCLDLDPTDRARTARALEADGSALALEERAIGGLRVAISVGAP